MSALTVDIATPEKVFCSQTTATLVSAPATLGRIGVLPGHMPLVSTLDNGELRVEEPGGKTIRLQCEGGFIQVQHDQVIILIDKANPE